MNAPNTPAAHQCCLGDVIWQILASSEHEQLSLSNTDSQAMPSRVRPGEGHKQVYPLGARGLQQMVHPPHPPPGDLQGHQLCSRDQSAGTAPSVLHSPDKHCSAVALQAIIQLPSFTSLFYSLT